MLTHANRSVKTMKQPYANRSILIELFPERLDARTDHTVSPASSPRPGSSARPSMTASHNTIERRGDLTICANRRWVTGGKEVTVSAPPCSPGQNSVSARSLGNGLRGAWWRPAVSHRSLHFEFRPDEAESVERPLAAG
jgi:hypothetical protein